MAKHKELRHEDELCLPSHLLSDGYFFEEARSKPAAAAFGVSEEMAGGEDSAAALAWHLAHARVCHVSSLSLRFPEEHRDDLLPEAAAQVARLRLRHAGHFQDIYDRRLLAPPKKPKKPSMHPPLPVVTNNARAVLTAQQQMWATQLHYLEQQWSAAWETQGKARRSRPLSQWPPPPQQQHPVRPGNGMKAVFLNSSLARRASTGTGVFLPRTHGSKPEPLKTPACSTVLVPARARVSHALNSTLEELGSQPRFANKNDGRDSQSNAMVSLQNSKCELVQPTSIVSVETHLPHEWTY